MSQLKEEALKEVSRLIGPILVEQGRAVLAERDHIKTGELYRTLRWRRSGNKVRISGKFYGRIVDARHAVMKKVPPGPQPEGWITKATEQAIVAYRFNLGLLPEKVGDILADVVRQNIRIRGR